MSTRNAFARATGVFLSGAVILLTLNGCAAGSPASSQAAAQQRLVTRHGCGTRNARHFGCGGERSACRRSARPPWHRGKSGEDLCAADARRVFDVYLSSQYYAGYGEGFVEDLISYLDLSDDAVLVDPWNGAGTTTAVATRLGRISYGFDINPVLVIIGKSKLLGFDVVESLDALTAGILTRAGTEASPIMGDPLEQWFTQDSARSFRAVERAIQHLLVRPNGSISYSQADALDTLSALAASFYVVLFDTVRSFLAADYTTTNPTWFKVNKTAVGVSISMKNIQSRFRALERQHHAHLHQLLDCPEGPDARATVALASSTALPLADTTAGACIASPPYCTRIDYAILTRPELAVLGIGDDDAMRTLRDAGIGTPTITSSTICTRSEWGSTTTGFLARVKGHASKASATYYHRFFVQYFDSMHKSLKELRRVLCPEAPCALVVQDSFYKEVHNDLAQALTEMASGLGWRSQERIDFEVPRTRAAQHPGARQYRSDFSAVESVVIFRP